MAIDIDTKIIGLIGYPIGHSMSPTIHNALYNRLDMNYIYMAFNISKDNLHRAVEGMHALSFIGFNVTVPYKERIIKSLDTLDKESEIIGAVNTVKIEDNKLIGYNTDGMGFMNGLARLNFSPSGKDIIVLGAGGSARAICVYLLKENPKNIYILNRTFDRGLALADELNKTFHCNIVRPIKMNVLDNLKPDILINTTSVGMYPHINDSPLEKYDFHPNTVVVDIIYNPHETRFLKEAREQGCRTQNGLAMLIGQALASIEIWTGQKISYEQCQNILRDDKIFIDLSI